MKLPVLEVEAEIRAAMRKEMGRLLLKAPTGSGKSTSVPSMVRDEVKARVLVVQPRRMAARLLAEYFASLEKTPLGKGVGYAVRFDSRWGDETEILFMTDGVLQRWLLDDPELKGVGAVIFDEFHERRLASDLALGRVLDLQENLRPDLRVVVMSATLELKGLEEYLAPCASVETGGRLFPVEIEHRAEAQMVTRRGGPQREKMIWDRVAEAVHDEAPGMENGSRILVFLPGLHEIRKTVDLLERASWLSGWEIMPLYSALPPAKQRAAIEKSAARRIIVSTNVAETSVTIEGVKTVIDSGLARMSVFDARRSMDSLRIEKIARAAAEQRAGRAGRTGPGRCVRLWSESDHQRREDFEIPEVKRVDLAEAVLFLKRLGVRKIADFRWLEQPETAMREQAESLLQNLGALDAAGEITEQGHEMARWPMHPRLSRLMLAGMAENCVAEVAFIAAAVQSEGVFKRGGHGPKWAEFGEKEQRNDFAAEWAAVESARAMNFHPGKCNPLGIMARGAREAWQGFLQYVKILEKRGIKVGEIDFWQRGEASVRAMLQAYGDRLSVRLDEGSVICNVVGGRRGKLEPKSVVRRAPIFVAVEMMEIEGRERAVMLSRCAAVEESWLTEQFPDEMKEEKGTVFDDISRRVTATQRRVFRGLVIEEKRGGEVDPNLAASLLAERVLAGDLVLKHWDKKVESWIARLVFLSEKMPELELPGFGADDRRTVLEEVCAGGMSYRDVKDRDPWPALMDWLSAPQRVAMESYAPTSIKLVNGRETKVKYAPEAEPWIELKVQQLYGVAETPCIANGHALTVKLLGPNMRPWQVTKDLPAFWERGFAQMKKELAGRYPKHDWSGG